MKGYVMRPLITCNVQLLWHMRLLVGLEGCNLYLRTMYLQPSCLGSRVFDASGLPRNCWSGNRSGWENDDLSVLNKRYLPRGLFRVLLWTAPLSRYRRRGLRLGLGWNQVIWGGQTVGAEGPVKRSREG
jgi:hypothetical protein